MSRLITNSIRSTSASADAITLDGSGNATFPANVTCSGTAAGFGGGKVLQVIQTTKTSKTSITSQTSFADIPGMSATITPSATSSKILVQFTLSTSTTGYFAVNLLRGSTDIFLGDTDGSRQRCTIGVSRHDHALSVHQHGTAYLDSPSTTSATTYKLQTASPWDASYHMVINGTTSSDNGTWVMNGTSTITLTEIAA